MGDVLEHLEQDTAVEVMATLRKHCKYMVLSLPIVEWIQGESEGNPHEAHLYHWSHEEVKEHFKPMRAKTGEQIGVYILKGGIT
jgi:hypothetical protein